MDERPSNFIFENTDFEILNPSRNRILRSLTLKPISPIDRSRSPLFKLYRIMYSRPILISVRQNFARTEKLKFWSRVAPAAAGSGEHVSVRNNTPHGGGLRGEPGEIAFHVEVLGASPEFIEDLVPVNVCENKTFWAIFACKFVILTAFFAKIKVESKIWWSNQKLDCEQNLKPLTLANSAIWKP